MTTPDDELPEEIESRIDPPNYDQDLTQRSVAREFVHGSRPYYNVTKMRAALGGDVSRDTVRSRMEELYQRDVLEREEVNNGDIYWLDQDVSRWPVPSDVEVQPENNELTVSEWRRQGHIRVAGLSVMVAILGTAVTLIGTFGSGAAYDLPGDPVTVIATGLAAGMLSYVGLFFAGVIWILDISSFDRQEGEIF